MKTINEPSAGASLQLNAIKYIKTGNLAIATALNVLSDDIQVLKKGEKGIVAILPGPNKKIDTNPFGNDVVERRIHTGPYKICETTKTGTDKQIIEKDVLEIDHIVGEIYDDFKDLSVARVDGVEMRYWNPESEINSDPSRQILSGILKVSNGNGSCLAWSQLLHETFDAIGIPGSMMFEITINTPEVQKLTSLDLSAMDGGGFLVKNWNFDKHIAPTGANVTPLSSKHADDDFYTIGTKQCIVPGKNGVLESTFNNSDELNDGVLSYDSKNSPFKYKFTGVLSGPAFIFSYNIDCAPTLGVNGQMNIDPPAFFGNHYVVKYNQKIYDPSYGTGSFSGVREGQAEHENASIDGIEFHDYTAPDLTFFVLQSDPNVDEEFLQYN